MKSLSILVLAILIAPLLDAQPTFEVAIIKPGRPDQGFEGGCHGIDSKYDARAAASAPPLGRCVITNARLSHLLAIAYHVRSMNQIEGGPDWVKMGDVRFDLEAKVDDPSKTTEDQLYQMLQALLTERFHLKFHRQMRDVQGFALVIAKNGPKLREAKSDETDFSFGAAGKPMPGRPITLTASHYSMPELAILLGASGRPVIDKTGLTGAYDFTLSWDDANGPQLSTALQQQLGLKFEPEKVPVQFIIVDSAQKPGEN